jgi:nanoRNase/pAp phosphatase (c-di-AMP/oligoRNAs hydrolase)
MSHKNNYQAVKDILLNGGRVLVSGHLSPDGDSLGSMIALVKMLRNAGIDAMLLPM